MGCHEDRCSILNAVGWAAVTVTRGSAVIIDVVATRDRRDPSAPYRVAER